MSPRRIGHAVAQDIVPDDLPDGAYFAMLDEVAALPMDVQSTVRVIPCPECRPQFPRKFATKESLDQHVRAFHRRRRR